MVLGLGLGLGVRIRVRVRVRIVIGHLHDNVTTKRILLGFILIFKFGSPCEVSITEALICTRKQNPEGS